MVSLTPSLIEPRFFRLLKPVFATIAEQKKIVPVVVTAVAWGLMWAQALAIVEIMSQWLCVLTFFGGIALGCGIFNARPKPD
jgi:hypothetical protein